MASETCPQQSRKRLAITSAQNLERDTVYYRARFASKHTSAGCCTHVIVLAAFVLELFSSCTWLKCCIGSDVCADVVASCFLACRQVSLPIQTQSYLVGPPLSAATPFPQHAHAPVENGRPLEARRAGAQLESDRGFELVDWPLHRLRYIVRVLPLLVFLIRSFLTHCRAPIEAT